MSQEAFALLLGITREMVNKMENGKGKISAKTIIRLQELFGPDLMKIISQKTQTAEANHIYRKHPWNGVPVYDVPLSASFIKSLEEIAAPAPAYFLDNQQFEDCDFGAQAKGDGMMEGIHIGDTLFCQPIKDFSFIDFGCIYFVVTRNGLELCRHIHPHPSDEKQLLLVSDHKNVPPSPIPRRYILKLYKIKGLLRSL
jgi:transcriptional regulator with XRE-family HTH domain